MQKDEIRCRLILAACIHIRYQNGFLNYKTMFATNLFDWYFCGILVELMG